MFFEFKVKFWQEWKKYVLNAFTHDREPYHIGWTNLTDVEDIETRLIMIGYQPNYFSFGDEGQVTSMRKMYIDEDGYWRQLHIRVHKDGEIRGHDELSYEESATEHVNGVDLRQVFYHTKVSVIDSLEGWASDIEKIED